MSAIRNGDGITHVEVVVKTKRGRVLATRTMSVSSEEKDIDTEAGVLALSITAHKPVAICNRCNAPLVFTFEFRGWEFYCQACGWGCGMFGCSKIPSTKPLRNRLVELRAAYEVARAERQAEKP